MSAFGLDVRRTYLIARRDYLGYIKTWGFWISFFLPVVFIAIGFFASTLKFNVEPVRYETLLDDTGKYSQEMLSLVEQESIQEARLVFEGLGQAVLGESDRAELMTAFDTKGEVGARAFLETRFPALGARLKLPRNNTVYVDPPALSISALQPYLRGEKKINVDGKAVRLNGVLHIYEDTTLHADYWSEGINSVTVRRLAQNYFKDRAIKSYLATGQLTPEGLEAAQEGTVYVSTFDPSKVDDGSRDGQAVTLQDSAPYYVAMFLSIVLWFTVFSGSYMLLTSMLEEKMNKLLEMMLASTRFSEIMFGKLIGVAALTVTTLLPYLIASVVGVLVLVQTGDPELAAGLRDAFSVKMVIFFLVFLVLGYVFYGAFFIAMGAMANSMQDAQTLTTPVMLILTSCVFVVPLGIRSPDSPILVWASWFPLSAPFASIVRIPSDPPLWQLIGSASFVFISACLVIWIAGRLFRYGVLSGSGVKGLKSWVARTVFRRKA